MKKQPPKFIFVVGGVMSSVGKGVTSASVGALFKAQGFSVTAIKADPYINVDAGTMNPVEHGEVFVTNDGDETDQDMGNYERFLEINLDSENYMTTGRVYQTVIQNERSMKYKGKCVEVVPDIPNEMIRRIQVAQKKSKADITIIEIGATVGEYQVMLFLEAARIMKVKYPDDLAFVLVSYLPIPKHVGEMKTKPTQYAVRTLGAAGIQADFIVARGERALDAKRREILGRVCSLLDGTVVAAPDAESIYDVPLIFHEQGFENRILQKLHLKPRKTDLSAWRAFSRRRKNAKKTLRIGVVGKYFGTGDFTLADSYISVIEAAKHAAWAQGAKPELTWIDSEDFEKNPRSVKKLKQYNGIIVPGGFGQRGIEGIMKVVKYARENNIPYFGLCYGMQLACIEFVRNVVGRKGANTVESKPDTKDPVIHVNPTQAKNIRENRYGNSMRLGAYKCKMKRGSKAQEAYGALTVSERHRHRYEFNNKYRKMIDAKGLKIVGVNPESDLVEIVELEGHPFFVGVQFHPEFQSRPMNPHPLFREFVKAALKKRT